MFCVFDFNTHVNTLLDQRDQTHAKHIHFHIISLIHATGVTSKAVMSIYALLLAMSTLYTYVEICVSAVFTDKIEN